MSLGAKDHQQSALPWGSAGDTAPAQATSLPRPEAPVENTSLRAPWAASDEHYHQGPSDERSSGYSHELRGGGATYGGVGDGDHYFWRPGPPAPVFKDDGTRGAYENPAQIGLSSGQGGLAAGTGAGGGSSSAGASGDFLTGPVVMEPGYRYQPSGRPSAGSSSRSGAAVNSVGEGSGLVRERGVDASARGMGGPGAPFDPSFARVYR